MTNTRILELRSEPQCGTNTCWAQVLETLDRYYHPTTFKTQSQIIQAVKKCKNKKCCTIDALNRINSKCDIPGTAFPDHLSSDYKRNPTPVSQINFLKLKTEIIENIDKGQPLIFSNEVPHKSNGHSLLIKGYTRMANNEDLLIWVVDPTAKNSNVLISAQSLFHAKVKKMDLFISDISSLSSKSDTRPSECQFEINDLLRTHADLKENAKHFMSHCAIAGDEFKKKLDISLKNNFVIGDRIKMILGENGYDNLHLMPIHVKGNKYVDYVIEIESYSKGTQFRFYQISEQKVKCDINAILRQDALFFKSENLALNLDHTIVYISKNKKGTQFYRPEDGVINTSRKDLNNLIDRFRAEKSINTKIYNQILKF